MRILAEMGCYSLDLTVDDDADLDGQFRAVCNLTGDRLAVNGWLIEDLTMVAEASQ